MRANAQVDVLHQTDTLQDCAHHAVIVVEDGIALRFVDHRARLWRGVSNDQRSIAPLEVIDVEWFGPAASPRSR